MGVEIERKFLLANDNWRAQVSKSSRLSQGYLARGEDSAIRVRVKGEQAELNIKKAFDGINRMEFEYAIPIEDARQLIEKVALRPLIDKTRHIVVHEGHTWEIDEFYGENAGLVMAEIELAHEDESFARPDWLGKEVSDDKRYYNSNLSTHPFSQW